MKRDQLIARLVRQDWESVPPQNLKSIRTRAFRRSGVCTFPNRLSDAERWLLDHPLDPTAVELYLVELIGDTRREISSGVALGQTFVGAVERLGDDVLGALPTHARNALAALAKVAAGAEGPVPIGDPWQIGHALAVDGKLVEWLLGDEAKQAKPKPKSAKAVYRRLAQENHPDRGGDPAVMSAINELYSAMEK